ncbi:MAG: fibronectin type III domain-containing protein, partial [Terracidiphilus sp.]
LLVAPGPHLDHALDSSIHFGETYEYRAQRVARVTVNGETLELAGPFSSPVRVAAVNVYPPAVPKGLAAVATAGEAAAGPAIDLNWQPGTEADLEGYVVYRREADTAENSWQRISPARPVTEPDYHDANVQPGHTYLYAVSAVDQQGHESARSTETEETVPAP